MKGGRENKIIIQDGELGNIQSSLDYFLKFNIPKDAKILDVGCNYGSLIFNLHSLGYKNIFGVEINKNAIEKGKTFYPEISNNLNTYEAGNIPFENNTFDVILMFDVIEHIPNVDNFLKNEVRRILRTGGTFIFQTPNKLINIPWEIISGRSLVKWRTYHCSLQTPSSLKKCLIKLGFSGVTIEKGNILTQHNKDKVRKKIGLLGPLALYFLSEMPLAVYPNMWGSCKKQSRL